MKKVLLGSTALVAASLLAGPAFAQLELSISGSVDVHMGFADEETPTGVDSRGYGITTDTTLNFNAAGVADNGLEYGSRINVDDTTSITDIETSTSGGTITSVTADLGSGFAIDEAWVYVSGSFGEIRFGETDPAASELRLAIPTVGNGQADGDFERYVGAGGANGATSFGTDFDHSSDAAKIEYIGEFGPATVGLSFTPSDDALRDDPSIIENDGETENVFSLGGNYIGEFQNVSVGVSAGFNLGDVVGNGGNPGGDLTEWGLGAEVGFGAITVGGFYIDTERENSAGIVTRDRIRYGLGATFSTGPWSFAANGLLSEDDKATGGADDVEDTVYGVGVEYSLADGLTPYADLVFFDFDGAGAGAGNDNDGSVFLVGVTASF